MATVEYSDRAAEWLRKADRDVQEQVLKRFDAAKEWPEHFVKPMSGAPYYVLRAGEYRAVVDWRREEEILFVRRIGHRRNVYDR